MQAPLANSINAVLLIILNAWSFYNAVETATHSLVLLFLGIVLIAMNNGILYHSKGQTIFAFIITLLVLFIIVKPAMKAYDDNDRETLIFLSLTSITSIISAVYLLYSVYNKSIKN